MDTITIYPEGEIAIGHGRDDDGTHFVQIGLQDGGGAQNVTLDFELAAFVAFADHLRMVADQLLSEAPPSTGGD